MRVIILVACVTLILNTTSAPRFDDLVGWNLRQVPANLMESDRWSNQVYRLHYWWLRNMYGRFVVTTPGTLTQSEEIEEFYLVPQPKSLDPRGEVMTLIPSVLPRVSPDQALVFFNDYLRTTPRATIRCFESVSQRNRECRFAVYSMEDPVSPVQFVPVDLGGRHVGLVQLELLEHFLSEHENVTDG